MLPRVLFAGMVLVGRARAEYVKPAGWLSIDRERACQVVRQAGRQGGQAKAGLVDFSEYKCTLYRVQSCRNKYEKSSYNRYTYFI